MSFGQSLLVCGCKRQVAHQSHYAHVLPVFFFCFVAQLFSSSPPPAAMSRPARAPALDQSRSNHEHAHAHHFGHAEAEEIVQYPHLDAGSVAYGVDKFVEYGQLTLTRQPQQFVGCSSVASGRTSCSSPKWTPERGWEANETSSVAWSN
jgi:hypothetical protein